LSQLALPVFALLAYPHLARLHARLVRDPARAERINLLLDGVLLGMVAAQAGFALWASFAFVLAICVNNAICTGPRHSLIAFLLFFGAGLAWYSLLRPGFQPDTSTVVTALCAAGTVAYVALVGLVVNWQNVHLVKTRNALLRREEQFRFIAEHAGDFVAVLDAKGGIRYTSGAYLERFDPNLTRIGSHWSTLIELSHRGRARDFLLSLLQTGTSGRISLDFRTSDGTPLELETAANVMQDTDGEGPRVLLISRARSQAEQAKARAFPGDIVARQAAYGLLVTDVLGRIELASPGMAKMSGNEPGSLIGKTIGEIAEAIPASDSLLDDVWRSLETSGACQCKVLLLHTSGQLKFAWANVVPLSGQDKATLRYAWTFMEESAPAGAARQPAAL
jgi:PAS domain-containing protein